MKPINELDITNKTVLIRFDYNVPINKGKIINDFRIKASFETINYCLSQNSSIVIMSHLGRPNGYNSKLSLKPIQKYLNKYYKNKIYFSDDCISSESIDTSKSLKPGQIHLLENLRFYKQETDNNKEFSKKLSKHANIYVCDSFGTSHRSHASNSKILNFFEYRCIGLLMIKEFDFLHLKKSLGTGIIIGGAKISTKIKMINFFLDNADSIFIGGAMAFTFLKSKGLNVGLSMVENDMLDIAKGIIGKSKLINKKIILPIDVVCVKNNIDSNKIFIKNINNLEDNDIGLDIGPQTIKIFKNKINNLDTVIWNGPLGFFENKNFSHGTIKMSKFLKKMKNKITIIGGGDTVSAIEMYDTLNGFSHVSTGGGASLKLLSGEKLNLTKSWEKY